MVTTSIKIRTMLFQGKARTTIKEIKGDQIDMLKSMRAAEEWATKPQIVRGKEGARLDKHHGKIKTIQCVPSAISQVIVQGYALQTFGQENQNQGPLLLTQPAQQASAAPLETAENQVEREEEVNVTILFNATDMNNLFRE